MLEDIAELLSAGQNVLLCGPSGVGKTALIAALERRDIIVIDPFEHVHSRLAARIRRTIYRGAVHLGATTSLDRAHLGAVRRIAFWFTVVRVPPISALWMRRLILRQCRDAQIPDTTATPSWRRAVLRLARGRPGMAMAMVDEAAAVYRRKGALSSPDAAYIEARLRMVAGSGAIGGV
jgi:hypothetical protein